MEKAEILRHMHGVHAAWWAAVQRIPVDRLEEPMGGPWSARDEITHVTFYDRRLAGRLLALARGDDLRQAESYDHPEPMPAFTTLDEFNATILARYATMPSAEVVGAARRAFDDLVVAIEALPEEHWHLQAPFTYGRTLAQFMPGTTWVHYAKHLPPLETFITRLHGG